VDLVDSTIYIPWKAYSRFNRYLWLRNERRVSSLTHPIMFNRKIGASVMHPTSTLCLFPCFRAHGRRRFRRRGRMVKVYPAEIGWCCWTFCIQSIDPERLWPRSDGDISLQAVWNRQTGRGSIDRTVQVAPIWGIPRRRGQPCAGFPDERKYQRHRKITPRKERIN